MLEQIQQGQDILSLQLNDEDVDDSQLESDLATQPIIELSDLQFQSVYRMIYSKKQLREVMTWFWENHFNTNFNTHQELAYEVQENALFRTNALGRFRDLLGISAKSPAMLYYLNNAENRVGRANENYAREIMELHTLGVDGGYDADDIAELSKIFTGWHENNGEFFFNAEQHDFTNKDFLGQSISGEGLAEGELALDMLANHPSTAAYLCSKLLQYFVDDELDTGLQVQCAAEFISSQGDIKSVLNVIFLSEAFASQQVARQKVKTPLELVASLSRSFAAQINGNEVHEAINDLGQPLFTFPVPTGYSELGEDWLNTNAILQRIKLINSVAWLGAYGIELDLAGLLISKGLDTSEAIVSYLVNLAYAGAITELEFNAFVDILNQDEQFDLNSQQAESKLKRLLASMASAPAFQMQ